MMLTMSSMQPFHLLGQDVQKEMQGDLFGQVILFTSASFDVNGLINGTTAFV